MVDVVVWWMWLCVGCGGSSRCGRVMGVEG